MNLREAFRYQSFLDSLMRSVETTLISPMYCMNEVKVHKRSKANPDAQDTEELRERDGGYFPPDAVIAFGQWLVEERMKLSVAIGRAKASVGFDPDAVVSANKFRQSLSLAIRRMMREKPTKKTEVGRDYKFNVEGNQVQYYYEVEVSTTENYDRCRAKQVMMEVITEADRLSSEVDAVMVNTQVEYEPRYDVNETFEDIMTDFCS